MLNPYSTPDQQGFDLPASDRVAAVRGLQIISAALAVGVLVFMGVTLVVNEGALDGSPDVVSWVGLGFAAIMFVSHLVIPGIVAGTILNGVDAERLRNADAAEKFAAVMPALSVRTIIACALLEGAAFMNLVAYLTSQFSGNLVAAAILVVLIGIRIPSISSVQFWVDDRIHEIEAR